MGLCEHRISIFGDVAILTGRWISRGENNGLSFDYTARFMAVYVCRSGAWHLVTDQPTPLSE